MKPNLFLSAKVEFLNNVKTSNFIAFKEFLEAKENSLSAIKYKKLFAFCEYVFLCESHVKRIMTNEQYLSIKKYK